MCVTTEQLKLLLSLLSHLLSPFYLKKEIRMPAMFQEPAWFDGMKSFLPFLQHWTDVSAVFVL